MDAERVVEDANRRAEQRYVDAGHGRATVPWDRPEPSALLVEWFTRADQHGGGRAALVVGCGLGRDAELVAVHGFRTTAFDVSTTAIEAARGRHVGSAVDYVVADLFSLPAAWRGAFDLVVESQNLQSLPRSVRGAAIAAVASTVAPGGRLVVISLAADIDDTAGDPDAPGPWPLTEDELGVLTADGLETVQVERLVDATDPSVSRWRLELTRPS